MTTLEIKFEVIKQWRTITAGAKELECSRSQLSYCIHGKRKVPALRKKLADALGTTVEELFSGSRNSTGVAPVSQPRFPR